MYDLLSVNQAERFWGKVYKTDGCWLWCGYLESTGYGRCEVNRVRWRVHRLSYTLRYGDIPNGLVLDHLCRVRNCVNPDHLEAVTSGENSRRGDYSERMGPKVSHCKQGHAYDSANTYVCPRGRRGCRICRRNSAILWRERHRGK